MHHIVKLWSGCHLPSVPRGEGGQESGENCHLAVGSLGFTLLTLRMESLRHLSKPASFPT